jgi:hypothetical protein
MPKKNAGRHEATAAAVAAAPAAPSREIVPEPDRTPWITAFCILSIFLLALMWYPISRIGAHYSESNFDGFNLHYQEALARGERLYGSPPKYT